MKNKIITIRFNDNELKLLENMGNFLGLSSTSAIVKCCLPWAKQRIDRFLNDFQNVIQPLKTTEIDSLITTMDIIGKKVKKQKADKNL